MMPHGRALLLGASGTVQGRFGRWFSPILSDLHHEFDALLKEKRWLAGQPFDTIHHVIRFGPVSEEEIEIGTVDVAHCELPTASCRAMAELHAVFLDQARLRAFLKEEIIRSLRSIGAAKGLSPLV